MNKDILALAKKFIAIRSTFDEPEGLREILELAISKLKGFKIERFEHNGVKSVLIYKGRTRPKRFKVILSGHLDVVPGKEGQYRSIIKNGRLYGVGSGDMKGNVACLIAVFTELAGRLKYPLGLQLVTDEEVGGFNGAKYQVAKGVRADLVIAAEPTDFDIVHKAKGILQLKVCAKGVTAHSAYPWRGDNAILRMNGFLSALMKKYPVGNKAVWRTTVNVSRIETTNSALNKIPDDCTVWLDIRFIPEDAKMIRKNVQKLLPERCELEVLIFEPAMSTDKNSGYVKLLRQVVKKAGGAGLLRGANGSSDARHFVRVGCGGVEFGPICGGIGSDREWVGIASLKKYHSMLKRFLEAVNSGAIDKL